MTGVIYRPEGFLGAILLRGSNLRDVLHKAME